MALLPVAAKVVKTVVGRAIHSAGRQPIIPVQGSNLGPGNVPHVPATSVRNPFQRYPHSPQS